MIATVTLRRGCRQDKKEGGWVEGREEGRKRGRKRMGNRECCQPVARATCFERSVHPPHQPMPHCYATVTTVRCFKPTATRAAASVATSPERSPKQSRAHRTAKLSSRESRTHYRSPPSPCTTARASRGPAIRSQFHSWGHALSTSPFASYCYANSRL